MLEPDRPTHLSVDPRAILAIAGIARKRGLIGAR
jgi:hypothetical protein